VLKLRGVHTIGEWFNVSSVDASSAILKVVRDFVEAGTVDPHLAETRERIQTRELELSLAELMSLKWRVSKRGNEWLRLNGTNITVFRRGLAWRFVLGGEFSSERFDTKTSAKVAALQAFYLQMQNANPSRKHGQRGPDVSQE
jgi:hypothetical protein